MLDRQLYRLIVYIILHIVYTVQLNDINNLIYKYYNSHLLECPPNAPIVNCFTDPCDVTSCNNYPNAKCVSNYCGGCNAQFFVDGIDVTKQCGRYIILQYVIVYFTFVCSFTTIPHYVGEFILVFCKFYISVICILIL